jgi:hypothetical protein
MICFALLASSLNACVPNAVTYYRPVVEGGKLLTPHCVPTESIVEFNLPDANGRLHIRAWANNGKHVHQISLFFSGKGWRMLHFTSTHFQIRDIGNHAFLDIASVLAYKSDSITDLTTEPYPAPPERTGLSRFHVQINSSDPLPDRFELLSPSIVIDGDAIVFPPIRFEQKHWFGISPLNC